jgi:hypothetical protein
MINHNEYSSDPKIRALQLQGMALIQNIYRASYAQWQTKRPRGKVTIVEWADLPDVNDANYWLYSPHDGLYLKLRSDFFNPIPVGLEKSFARLEKEAGLSLHWIYFADHSERDSSIILANELGEEIVEIKLTDIYEGDYVEYIYILDEEIANFIDTDTLFEPSMSNHRWIHLEQAIENIIKYLGDVVIRDVYDKNNPVDNRGRAKWAAGVKA